MEGKKMVSFCRGSKIKISPGYLGRWGYQGSLKCETHPEGRGGSER